MERPGFFLPKETLRCARFFSSLREHGPSVFNVESTNLESGVSYFPFLCGLEEESKGRAA